MLVIHPIRRSDYLVLKFVRGIVWLAVAIASGLLLIVLAFIVFSPLLDTFGFVILPVALCLPVLAGFAILSYGVTDIILHTFGWLYRSFRRFRLPDPALTINQGCFHPGQPITITLNTSGAAVHQVEVQLLYRLEHDTVFNFWVTTFSVAGLRKDQVMDTVLHAEQGVLQSEQLILKLPDTLPPIPAAPEKTRFGIINFGTEIKPVWLAKVTVRVAGWLSYCEYYPITVC